MQLRQSLVSDESGGEGDVYGGLGGWGAGRGGLEGEDNGDASNAGARAKCCC